MVKIYTTDTCPKCKILKEKMDLKGIEYTEVHNNDALIEKGIFTVPVLEVDGKMMNMKEANDWINK